MATTLSPPQPAAPAPPPRPEAAGWQVWTGLWIVYIVWGSTYLAIRVVVETVPPFLSAGARFVLRGRGDARVPRRGAAAGPCCAPTARQLLSCLAVGTLLMGANAVVSVAEVEVPSSMAALLIASVPLWVILYRRGLGDRVSGRSVVAVLVGFAGVALLLLPGKQTGGASLIGLLAVVAAAAMWAGGSVASPRLTLPRDPFVSGALADAARGRSLRADRRAGRRVRRLPPRRVQPPLGRRASRTSSSSGPGSRSPPTPGCCRTRRSPGSRRTPTSIRSWRSRSAGRSSTRR